MEITNALNAIAPVLNGMSCPYRIKCDDGNEYYVKIKDNPNGCRFLVNEYISSKIANMLQLPIPNSKLINFDENFITIFGDTIQNHIDNYPSIGLHFGSQSIPKSTVINNAKLIEKCINSDILSSVLLFDHLIGNIDRMSNMGNLLLDIEKKELVVIDHSHAFQLAAVWDEAQLNRLSREPIEAYNMNEYVYSKWVKFIKGNNPFKHFFDNLEQLTDSSLELIINGVPDEWNVSQNEKFALMNYLVTRRDNINTVLPLSKPQLPYWKGGI